MKVSGGWLNAKRFDPADANTTYRPSGVIAGSWLLPLLGTPFRSLTRTVDTAPASSNTPSASVSRSRRNTSWTPVSPGTRLCASETKAMNRPVAEATGWKLEWSPGKPFVETLTSTG